jgi:hypothetical protein
MTEPYDDRAERAFRQALAREGDAYEPVELDPTVAAARRRSWWRPALVAAAVVALVGGTTLAVSWPGDDSRRPPAGGSPTTAKTALEPGWRYESFLDVVVQVPDSWGYASAPAGDWCAFDQPGSGYAVPTEPFVDTRDRYGVTVDIGCIDTKGSDIGGGVPEQLLSTHLSFAADGDYSEISGGTVRDGDWTRITRTVGAARITVLTDSAHLEQSQEVIDSARVVDTDQNGCAASSPIQQGGFARPKPAFDVTGLDVVDSLAVCQYDLNRPPGKPGLLASRLLTGADAATELSAIRAGAPGGGPDTPDTCVHDMHGDTGLVLRLTTGPASYDLYVYYDWCFGNGFDDGTTRYELTKTSCVPLFKDRVQYSGGSSAPFNRCHD